MFFYGLEPCEGKQKSRLKFVFTSNDQISFKNWGSEMRFVLSRTMVKKAKHGTARLEYMIVVDLPFPCEDVFKPTYRDYDHNRAAVTDAGTLLCLFEFELDAVEKPLNILTKNIGAQRVIGELDSNEEGEEMENEDGMDPDPVFLNPSA